MTARSGNAGFPSRYVAWMFRAVKILCSLILSLSLSPLMAADPGQAALDFLGKVRDGKLDLQAGGDTALLEHTTGAKRESISKRIRRLEMELREGELELGEVREDGGFAAAMIRKSSGFDSAEIQVFPIALVKRGDKWLAAPMPASFENAVAGYTVPLKKRLVALENWMTRERVTGLERLISESAKRTRDLIRNSIGVEELQGDNLGKITERFLEACEKGDRAAILGFLGGLSDPLPPDWADRLKVSGDVAAGRGDWIALASSEVIRIPVIEKNDATSGYVFITWLNLLGGAEPAVCLTRLGFTRDTSGRWRIDPPPSLFGDTSAAEGGEFPEADVLDLFSAQLRAKNPALGEATPELAAKNLLAALAKGELNETLRRVDFGGNPQQGRRAVESAAAFLQFVKTERVLISPVELGSRLKGSEAVFAVQWFSAVEPDRFDFRPLHFRHSPRVGWLWCPDPRPDDGWSKFAALQRWLEERKAEWRLSWREVLLRPSAKLDKLDFRNPPSDEEANALVGRWLEALGKKNLGEALACSAWLSEGQGIPMSALRNISYELGGADRGKAELLHLHRSGSWVAATIRRISADKTQDVFIPIVTTPAGARLLPEIDLIAEKSRTRNFLNKAAFVRIKKIAGEKRASELERLFEKSMETTE